MAIQTQTSQNLTAARALLDELATVDDPQAKATAAAAHATLVLAAGAVENGTVSAQH